MNSYDIVEWGKPLQLVVRDTPVPQGREVLLRVEACGVCHSDLHIQKGILDLGNGRTVSFEALGLALPFTLGHEIVGTVVATGPDATVEHGARRVVFPWIGCGKCPLCLRGDELACEANIALGTRRAGGYSDHVLVPDEKYLLDYGTLDPTLAATCACSGLTAYAALKKLPPLQADDTVLLIGAGGLGLAALSLAAELTAARTVVADIDPGKLELATERGAFGVVDLSLANGAARARELAGRGLRGVIDFVGSPTTLELALQAIGKGGTVIVVGLFGGALPLSTALLPSRNLTLRGSYVGTLAEMRELLALQHQRAIQPPPIASRSMGDINAVLDDLARGAIRGRTVVTP